MNLALTNQVNRRSHPFSRKLAANKLLFLAIVLQTLAFTASAQLINLNFTAGTSYSGSSETSPATPTGSAGTWNNISLTAANTDVAVIYADGSPGPTLSMDTGRSGNWTSAITTQTANYTGNGAVYAVPNLYESGFINGNNATLGFRLRGLAPGTYKVYLVPMYRSYDAAGASYRAGIHLIIGTGNTTDARDAGNYTLVTTDATPEQNIDTSLTSWVAATDGSTSYNYVTATVTIDSTNRWLTFLFEDGAEPDRPGPSVIQIAPADGIAPSSVPVITEALFASEGMILRGTNGPHAGTYQVIASTNITLPFSNWPAIGAYYFDSNGNFDSTNPVTAGIVQQYFRLLVGGAVPPPPTAPAITNQPQSLTVAIGANVNFSVGATGTTPLNYFWSLNTNTPVGGNSSTLSLNDVQTGDSGSYRVIITNSVGSATSSVATLTVLVPPGITDNPTNLAVGAGDTAVFNVTATGSEPLQYQWFDNTGSPIDGETSSTLMLVSVSTADSGAYFVTVSNDVGIVTSSNAVLTVLGPPVILTQPADHSATLSNSTTFTVEVAGPALSYQWFFNTNTPVGVNSNRLDLVDVQTGDAGYYNVIVTNNYGAVTSSFAMLMVNTSIVANAEFNLVGFGQNATGGGEISETDPAYVKVTNALQLANAVLSFNKTGGVKVIEIMNDLDLGWNEIGTNVQNLGSTPFNAAATPKLHPRLIQTGVSKMDIKYKNGGLTIFSANGATIRHCTFNIKSTHNIIIRNLKFDEMWEWDESSKGNYDGNDWDFIDLANGGAVYDVWIDHCTFTKAYDGIVDMKAGSTGVTLSWCRYLGDDGATNPNSFVWQQINSLESNKTSYAMYNFLRNNGFSKTNIVQIIQGHDKTHLMGANSLDSNNANLSCTFHHLWFQNCWDRVVPRLRAGNVHDFNIYVDDATALVAKRLRDAVQQSMSSSASNSLKNTYSFNPFLNGTISTENGAILVEKSIYNDCLSPLRNNQTDPSNSVYTGKIMALDCIYHFDNADTTTIDYRGDSTNAPGSTYFGPAQAPTIPFSWNGFTDLPYSYTNVLTDPSNLPAVLAGGAGAGVLTWDKTNWLKTSY
ncbi:MAG TPA: immunoglobulin domain-containing protein [Verrucomicrobiae bacterium]|nr:immunoglobulin domain-containing protein [Verrucomicrobiae bacterium]